MILHSKLSKRPTKRPPRRDHITNELLTRKRTSQHYEVRAMKALRPEGTSMKNHMASSTIGKAWLERKREAR